MSIRRFMLVLVAIAVMLSLMTPAFATQIDTESYQMAPSATAWEQEVDIPIIGKSDIQPRGTYAPTTSWDLSSHDYTIQFVTSNTVFSNVNFEKHNGDFYLDINCTSDKDQTMYVLLYEKGSTMSVTESKIDTDGGWNIHFYNLDTSKEYFLRFVKIDDGVSVYGYGTVHL